MLDMLKLGGDHMQQGSTLSDATTRRILEEISSGIYKDAKKLPAEKEIALHMGVSRTVVRDALLVLEREGFISRKHGMNTMINHHVLEIENRMDIKQEYCEEVRSCNCRATRELLHLRIVSAEKATSERLQITQDAAVFESACLIYADNRPAIFSLDYFSANLLVNDDYKALPYDGSIFEFLKEYCDTDIHMSITDVRAIPAEQLVAKRLDLAFATPVLYVEEVGYTFAGKPVLFSKEYYADGILRHTLLRKKI